jgi:hypothetical protein
MAENIFAPGVEQTVCEWNGKTAYFGTWEALSAAGLIPSTVERPQPNHRGRLPRWLDDSGQRCSLSGGRSGGVLQLLVSLTAKGRIAFRSAQSRAELEEKQAKRVRERIEAIDYQLGWSEVEGHLGYVISRHVGDALDKAYQALDLFVWPHSARPGPWTLGAVDKETLKAARMVCMLTLHKLKPTFDPTWRARLEAEREMLLPRREADSNLSDATKLLSKIAAGTYK